MDVIIVLGILLVVAITILIVSYRDKKKLPPGPEAIEFFRIGDKVTFNEKTIEMIGGTKEQKEWNRSAVYEVERKDVSFWQGTLLYLHCGTTMWADQAKKLPPDTPLRA